MLKATSVLLPGLPRSWLSTPTESKYTGPIFPSPLGGAMAPEAGSSAEHPSSR